MSGCVLVDIFSVFVDGFECFGRCFVVFVLQSFIQIVLMLLDFNVRKVLMAAS